MEIGTSFIANGSIRNGTVDFLHILLSEISSLLVEITLIVPLITSNSEIPEN